MELNRTSGRLEAFYQRYVHQECKTIDYETFDASVYDQATLRRGRRAWTLRTNDEYRSMVGFSELTHLCAQMHAPLDVVALASRLVRDEVRHVELCSQMTTLLGGRPAKAPEPTYVKTNENASFRRRALHHAIGSCAIGETISVTMLAGIRARCSDGVAQATLTQMLKDESFHARFGWLWLPSMNLTDEDRQWLDWFVPRIFRQLPSIVPSQSTPYIPSPFGAMPSTERRDRLFEAFDEIVQGFEDHGLPGRQWRRMSEGLAAA